MKRLLALLLVPACTMGERAESGQCPGTEVCSSKTPGGLDFVGADLAGTLFASGPSATAIGGTQKIALKYDPGNGGWQYLDLPYKAVTTGALGVQITDQTAAIVTVTGAASGTNYLRIMDGTDPSLLFDRKLVGAGAVDEIDLVPTSLEVIPDGAAVAWAPGATEIAVALYGSVGTSSHERLVDESMTLDLPGSHQTAWDTLRIENAVPGTTTLMVTAGDKPPAAMDIVVTPNADAVAPFDAPTGVAPSTPAQVCFTATTGTRAILGLLWKFTVDGAPGDSGLSPNCVMVKTAKTTGTVSITASAGGQTATLELPVTTMARAVTRTARQLPTTAGERAATAGEPAAM